jgi:gamma-glutamyltranspeptidase/glutathione hydrolase
VSTRALCRSGYAIVAAFWCAAPAWGATPVFAAKQMVVAANPHAAAAGIEILRAGGSAVDAAIAVQLVLSLVEPQSSGIGGGAFMLVFDAPADERGERQVTAYEGRESAPAAATPDMFLGPDGRPLGFGAVGSGGLAVGVPGALRMLELAHAKHGRLPWARLFEPAIELATDGFEISPRLHALLDGFKRFARVPEFRAHYYDSAGEPKPVGHRLVNTQYAATLRLLAARGAAEMYTGDLATAIVAAVRDNPVSAGRMTREDLRDYAAHETAPLCSPYREWRVCGPQLPSSGGVTAQQILGILEPFELHSAEPYSAGALHLIAEASRLAFADRNLYLADPAFVDAPVEALLSPRYLRERRALIERDKALGEVQPGEPRAQAAANLAPDTTPKVPGTSHFSIVDQWGDAVSMTTSVQSTFGSQLMVGGFILNNELTDFSYVPEARGRTIANRVEGGKRPLSSMTPSVILDEQGRLRMLIGSPGGTRIIGFVAQAIINVLDWDMNIQDAVAAPHLIAQDSTVELESDTTLAAQADALRALGHRVALRGLNSGLHGITIDYGADGVTLAGGVDPRREGVALGD